MQGWKAVDFPAIDRSRWALIVCRLNADAAEPATAAAQGPKNPIMKAIARHLLLVALLLRTLVPAGWMPNPAGASQTAFVICTMNGAFHAPGKQTPSDTRHHDECPFAAAPHLAKTPDAVILPAPLPRADRTQVAAIATGTMAPARYLPQSPRAPPVTV
jgi:hypothetical protein